MDRAKEKKMAFFLRSDILGFEKMKLYLGMRSYQSLKEDSRSNIERYSISRIFSWGKGKIVRGEE